MEIILTGSIAYDYLMKFPGYFKDHILPEHLESISLSFLVDDMVRQHGGVGANIAYTLALLGAHPRLVSTAGQDFPNTAKSWKRWASTPAAYASSRKSSPLLFRQHR